jgi:REP element-mobilizing transposase RayT
LDQGYGACVLEIPEVKLLVERTLRHFDGQRYSLDEFEVMPNHVHALVTPIGQYALSSILHSWKSFSAHQIVKVEAASRRLAGSSKSRDGSSTSVRRIWQKESFDHIVRNPESLEKFRQYIRDNRAAAAALRRVDAASRLVDRT